MTCDWIGTIPIYINNFNWLHSTKELAEFFGDVPGTEIVIVDNHSTYEPLLEWYSTGCPYRLIRLQDNLGCHAPWLCGAILPREVHRAYYGSEYYVLTDPDLSFAGCPKDVIRMLITGFDRYPEITKVGVSLETNDLPTDSPLAREATNWEAGFWRKRRDSEFFDADVDTTFALYKVGVKCDGKSLRSDRPYTARHLPWYFQQSTLTEEQRYYLQRAANQGWTTQLRNFLGLQAGADTKATAAAAGPPTLRDGWRPTDAERSRYDPQWAVSRELEEAILVILETFQPRSILETGPGLSSLLLYKYQQTIDGVTYVYLDHRGPANDSFAQHLSELGFSPALGFVCDLTEEYYDLSQTTIPADQKFELLLLDGPPDSNQRASRTQCEFVDRHGSPESVYFQDDTHRGPEASVITTLVERHGADHFVRFEIQDQTYTWRTSSLLIPRSRCPNPADLLSKLSGARIREPA